MLCIKYNCLVRGGGNGVSVVVAEWRLEGAWKRGRHEYRALEAYSGFSSARRVNVGGREDRVWETSGKGQEGLRSGFTRAWWHDFQPLQDLIPSRREKKKQWRPQRSLMGRLLFYSSIWLSVFQLVQNKNF